MWRTCEVANIGADLEDRRGLGIGLAGIARQVQLRLVNLLARAADRLDKIQPVGLRFSKDGSRVFVALGPANRVAVVKAESGEVEKYILVGGRVWHLALSEDGTKLITTNGGTDDITVIDIARLTAIKSITVGRQPWGVATVGRLAE